jgi:uncharacterized membrane protein
MVRRMAPAQAPWLHDLTLLAFVLHIGAGALCLVCGSIALFAPKGGPLHRMAGSVFTASMLVMGVFACYLGVVIPDQFVNVFIACFTIYLVTTAWLTVRRKEGVAGLAETIALIVAICLFAPFGVLSFQLATGLRPAFKSAVPFEGPVLVAIYVFASVLAIAAIGDARIVLARGATGAPRIARHLWRMCLGLTLTFGSAFTNGFARLLPGPYHVPPGFFLPQFAPLLLMVFWLIRVRFTGWLLRRPQGQG